MAEDASSIINTEYFTNLKAQIASISVCSELQEFSDEIMAEIQEQIDGINDQLSSILPIHALLSVPTDLGSVISWVQNMITDVITPLYKPYLSYIAQLEAMVTQVTELVSALEAAASSITSCSITATPPTITIPTPPV